MVRGAWQATVHEVAKSRTRLSDLTFTFIKECRGRLPGGLVAESALQCREHEFDPSPGKIVHVGQLNPVRHCY